MLWYNRKKELREMRQKETKNGLVALTDLQDAIESEMLQDLLLQ